MEDRSIRMTRLIPPKYRSYSADALPTDPSFNEVKRYHRELDEYFRHGVGLLLSGPNGVGKTGFLAVLFRYATRRYPQWGVADRVWTRARDVAQQYNYNYWEAEIGVPVDVVFQEAKLLVVDELGRESDIKNFDRRMHNLLQRRTESGLVTMYTTNLSLDAEPGKPGTVRTTYGEGFWSLIHQSCMVVTVGGPDRRKGEA